MSTDLYKKRKTYYVYNYSLVSAPQLTGTLLGLSDWLVFEHPILAHYLEPCLLFGHKLQDSLLFSTAKGYS